MVDERLTGPASPAAISWLPRLCLSLPLVFLIGVPSIVVTRIVLNVTYPDRFAHTIPSISKTAAYAPGSLIFAVGMSTVTLCIVTTWLLMRHVGYRRIMTFVPEGQQKLPLGLNGAASVMGIIAGLMLGALAVVSLEDNNDSHMVFSSFFFSFQLLAFAFDTALYTRLKRFTAPAGARSIVRAAKLRQWMCVSVGLATALFLYMFLTRHQGLLGDRYLAQQVYIFAEHAISFLSLGYPALLYPDILSHFRGRAHQA